MAARSNGASSSAPKGVAEAAASKCASPSASAFLRRWEGRTQLQRSRREGA